MYKIIGADGKEYGPISAEQLAQWIAEGRANAQTRVLPEGQTEWKAIAEVPELAHLASAAPAMPSSAAPIPIVASSPDAVNAVNGPAIGLMVVAILGFVLQALGLVWKLAFSAIAAQQAAQQPAWGNMFSGTLAIISGAIGLITSGIILFGGLKMKKLESYGLAMAASIIVMIPCISPCCLLGIPAGIWAITVLSKPEVKSAFH